MRESLKQISDLVERFERNIEAYHIEALGSKHWGQAIVIKYLHMMHICDSQCLWLVNHVFIFRALYIM